MLLFWAWAYRRITAGLLKEHSSLIDLKRDCNGEGFGS